MSNIKYMNVSPTIINVRIYIPILLVLLFVII